MRSFVENWNPVLRSQYQVIIEYGYVMSERKGWGNETWIVEFERFGPLTYVSMMWNLLIDVSSYALHVHRTSASGEVAFS